VLGSGGQLYCIVGRVSIVWGNGGDVAINLRRWGLDGVLKR
jgi:hypothetical protein